VQTIIHSKTNGPNIYIHCSFSMFRFNPKMFLINSAYNSLCYTIISLLLANKTIRFFL